MNFLRQQAPQHPSTTIYTSTATVQTQLYLIRQYQQHLFSYTTIPYSYTTSILQLNSSNTKPLADTRLGTIVIVIVLLFAIYLAYRFIKSRKSKR